MDYVISVLLLLG